LDNKVFKHQVLTESRLKCRNTRKQIVVSAVSLTAQNSLHC